MADNTTLDPGAGGDTIATDDVAGVKYQRVKLVDGTLDSTAAIEGTTANGLEVDVTRVQGSVAVTGPVTDAQIRATPLPVSGTVTADTELPAAAALSDTTANPTTAMVGAGGMVWDGSQWLRARGDATNGLFVNVKTSVLPTGAATETTLGGIKTGTDKIPASPSQEHTAAATPSSARLSDGAAFYDATKTGQLPAALAAGGGLKVEGVAGGVAQPVSGTVTANAGSGPFPVSDNAGTLTVDAPVGTPVFVRLSDGSAAIATLPVSLATLPALTTGSATIGAVNVKPSASGGLTTFHLVSAATTNATSVKGSAGQLYGYYIYNGNAAARKLAFHNTAGVPTAGASIFFSVVIPPSSAANVEFSNGIAFGTGIGITTVTEIADAGTTAVAVDDLNINLFYA